MYNTTISYKTRKQLEKFLGRISPHFSKPTTSFIGEALYSIQACGEVKLSSWVKVLNAKAKAKKVEDRLSRNLSLQNMDVKLQQFIMSESKGKIKDDTLIIVDPTDISKPYARKMEHLYTIRDGSKSSDSEHPSLTKGYMGCMAIAYEPSVNRIIPLHFRVWSTIAPDYISENNEITDIFNLTRQTHGTKGIYVIDRGGDNIEFFKYFHRNHLNFIVRLKRRNLISWNRSWDSDKLANQVTMQYNGTVTFNSGGKESKVQIKYGAIPVQLPDIEGWNLHLVVVKGFGNHPMILLTSLNKNNTRKDIEQVVNGYLYRWKIEETIRYIKQAYNLEDIRLMKYAKIKNMAALVLAVAFFAASWLGRNARMEILVEHLKDLSKHIKEVPDFFYYALAEGIRLLFIQHGKWDRTNDKKINPQLEFDLDWG